MQWQDFMRDCEGSRLFQKASNWHVDTVTLELHMPYVFVSVSLWPQAEFSGLENSSLEEWNNLMPMYFNKLGPV
jgi:hypothetical protein